MIRLDIISSFLVLLLASSLAQGQKEVEWNYETWWGVMTSTRVAEKWSLYNDIHYSNNLFVAYRTGVTYHPKRDNFITTVAYAYLKLTTPFSDGALIRGEHRPWMQMVYRVPSTRQISTSFRFKYDARFMRDFDTENLLGSFSFNHRWRFNNSLRFQIRPRHQKSTGYAAVILNEALVTTGPGPNGAPYEHRTHLMGEVMKDNVILSVGCMVRYLAFTPEFIRLTYGPVIWLTVNFSTTKTRDKDFFENPEDHY